MNKSALQELASCEHLNTKLFTREGADHTGVDLFARCPDCGFEGPYIECERPTPELRRKVSDAFDDEVAAALRALAEKGK